MSKAKRKPALPTDLDAEQGALSCVLISEGKAAQERFAKLQKSDFASQIHQQVFELIAPQIGASSMEIVMSAPKGDLRSEVSKLLNVADTPFQFEMFLKPLKDTAEKRSALALRAPRFAAYYDAGSRGYWIQNNESSWIEITESSAKRYIRHLGYSSKPAEGCLTSPLDEMLMEIQTERDVAWVGPLAGYKKGPTVAFGRRILVTDEARLIEPKDGPWPSIKCLVENLFGHQTAFVNGWLKVALESLRSREFRPGQALAIAGERGCGKSLFQNQIVTPLLGGRSAKPYRYMSGGSDFNGDLFGCEHLMIEDEVASTDLRARRHFGSRIKDFVANETNSHHAKNRNAITLRPFWRVSISLNDEPENLMILPPIDESLADKLMLLKAAKKPLPMPTGTNEERRRFQETITGELPGFVHYLLNEHEIDPVHKCERYGIIHYHHPEMLGALDELSPEKRLAEVIDLALFKNPISENWKGTATELQRELLRTDFCRDAERILTFNNAAGTYLGRLAKKHPARYIRRKVRGQPYWRITPPRV